MPSGSTNDTEQECEAPTSKVYQVRLLFATRTGFALSELWSKRSELRQHSAISAPDIGSARHFGALGVTRPK
jgi:hypothetical protein